MIFWIALSIFLFGLIFGNVLPIVVGALLLVYSHLKPTNTSSQNR